MTFAIHGHTLALQGTGHGDDPFEGVLCEHGGAQGEEEGKGR